MNESLNKRFNAIEVEELAKQLRCPDGEHGTAVAEKMNTHNITMTRSGIAALEVTSKDVILEIGHGNCGHLAELLGDRKEVRYFGLDISELMKTEAERINAEYIAQQIASFMLYDGEKIPFEDQKFTKILTVNTLYFWKHPVEFLGELYRVLQPNGSAVIVFALEESMKKAPVTAHGFTLYTESTITDLVEKTAFEDKIQITKTSDQFTMLDGKTMDREYLVVTLSKHE